VGRVSRGNAVGVGPLNSVVSRHREISMQHVIVAIASAGIETASAEAPDSVSGSWTCRGNDEHLSILLRADGDCLGGLCSARRAAIAAHESRRDDS
jgi:hypothetical protein